MSRTVRPTAELLSSLDFDDPSPSSPPPEPDGVASPPASEPVAAPSSVLPSESPTPAPGPGQRSRPAGAAARGASAAWAPEVCWEPLTLMFDAAPGSARPPRTALLSTRVPVRRRRRAVTASAGSSSPGLAPRLEVPRLLRVVSSRLVRCFARLGLVSSVRATGAGVDGWGWLAAGGGLDRIACALPLLAPVLLLSPALLVVPLCLRAANVAGSGRDATAASRAAAIALACARGDMEVAERAQERAQNGHPIGVGVQASAMRPDGRVSYVRLFPDPRRTAPLAPTFPSARSRAPLKPPRGARAGSGWPR